MFKVQRLFLKASSKPRTIIEVSELLINKEGEIEGAKKCLNFRQVLILPSSTFQEFKINPGDLNENIVVEGFNVHTLTSGTVLEINEVKIRLTYHCEPCAFVNKWTSIKNIQFKRGYLGNFLNPGKIIVGNEIKILETKSEPIPYKIEDRIIWFLEKQNKIVTAQQLLEGVGFSKGFRRAIPAYLKRIDEKYKKMVEFKNG